MVWGRDVAEHDMDLAKVLQRAKEMNLKLKVTKCKFRLESVSYVGHLFTKDGLKLGNEKIKAIKEMPVPENRKALQRFLGMLNYLHKFIENFSEKTTILRQLLRKDVQWCWQVEHQVAFEKLKDEISNPLVLKFFDPIKPVVLSVDASKNGLGAVCLQDGSPIAYASRVMTDTESRYAQIEKELLAALFACRKFHDFTYGNKVVIETDDKPLISIVKKPLHAAPARLQRMLLQLQNYDLEFVYKTGKDLFVADGLSRAYIHQVPLEIESNSDFEVLSVQSVSPTRMEELQRITSTDPTMQKLAQVIRHGWPMKCTDLPLDLAPYFPVRDELLVDKEIVLKSQRVVVLESLRRSYIEQLHKGHPGIEATKKRARDVVFWPTMTKDIERALSSCVPCNSTKPHQMKKPLKSHPAPELPWTQVSADIFEWNDMKYLVIVDAYSGWFETDTLHNMSSKTVIKKMKRLFAVHGIPELLMTDNGSQFVSREFHLFAKELGFKQVTSSPTYPQSNGLAENAVKQAKKLLEKSKRDGSDPMLGLLNLRNTPKDSNLGSPAQRLMSRRTQTVVPTSKKLFAPKVIPCNRVSQSIRKKRQQQKMYYDKSAKMLETLKENRAVRIQTTKGYDKLGVVKQIAKEPRSYIVESDGMEYRRNRRQLLAVPERIVKEEQEDEFVPSKFIKTQCQLKLFRQVDSLTKTVDVQIAQCRLEILQLNKCRFQMVRNRKSPVVYDVIQS